MIGDRIKSLREARAWTQAHLADAAGVSLRTIQRLETVHACSQETLLALASALDIDVRSLTEERMAPLAWRGPSTRAAAWWGALLAFPCIAFVAANFAKYGLGLAAPYDLLAATGGRLGLTGAFESTSPLLLLAAPIAAVLLNVVTLVRPRIRGGAVIAIDFRLARANLLILAAAGACAAVLSAYLVGETLNHIARGAL